MASQRQRQEREAARKAKAETPATRGHRTRRLSNGEAGASAAALRTTRRGGLAGVNAKQQLTDAFLKMGGVPALVAWGKSNKTEFYKLWARLIPKEEHIDVNTLTIEDVLAGLDAKTQQTDELRTFDEAGELLGLPRPSVDMARSLHEAEDARQEGEPSD